MAAKNFGRVNVSITASTGGLTAGLSQAGKQLTGFSSSVGGMNGSLAALSAQVSDGSVLFSDLSGLLGTVAVSFKNGALATHLFRGSIQLLMVTIKALLVPLAIVASVGGFFGAFRKAAEDIDAASKSAKRLGIEANSFESFSQVAEEAGVSVGQMTGMLTTLNRNVGNLGNGSKNAQQAFASLGLTFADLQGQSPERQFELISERIMALPNQQGRAAAAAAIFGKSGATALNFIEDAAGGAVTGVKELRTQLGYDLTSKQRAGVQLMNDSVGRMSMVFGGFIRQFVAELAPAIATAANLFVKFFAENTSGFSIAETMAAGLTSAIRFVAGAITLVYGVLQLGAAAWAKLGQVGMTAMGFLLQGLAAVQEGIAVLMDVMGMLGKGLVDLIMVPIKGIMSTLASLADTIGATDIAADLRLGMQVADGLTQGWDSFGDTVRGSTFLADAADAAFSEAAIYGDAADSLAASGLQNITSPFAAFDAEFASVTAQMQQAGGEAGAAAGESISTQLAASTKALKAIVVGTSDGEAFRNSIMRGADPRLEGDAQKETAENTGEMVDQLDELNGNLAGSGGFGLAAITV
jgi:hypothetical protein